MRPKEIRGPSCSQMAASQNRQVMGDISQVFGFRSAASPLPPVFGLRREKVQANGGIFRVRAILFGANKGAIGCNYVPVSHLKPAPIWASHRYGNAKQLEKELRLYE